MKTLVLFNGGLKDTFLATLAKKEGKAILCYLVLKDADKSRLKLVTYLADTLGLPLVVLNLHGSPPLEEVLLRMLYLVLHVLPVAKAKQCGRIYYGLSKDDDERVVPIMDSFVLKLNDLVVMSQPLYDGEGFWLGQVEIEAPLRRLDRARVIRLGNEYSVPWELTHSCSQNAVGTLHCGLCAKCIRRRVAFKREGCEDLTRYRHGKRTS